MLKFSGFANLTSCLERKRCVSRILHRIGVSSMAPSRRIYPRKVYQATRHRSIATPRNKLFATKACEKCHTLTLSNTQPAPHAN